MIVGLILGVAAVTPIYFVIAPWAAANCPLKGDNWIIGKDKGRAGNTIGNAGDVYVNDLASTDHGIVRSMISGNDIFANWVEFGWGIGSAYGYSSHTAFTAHNVNGSYQGSASHGGVTRNIFPRFKLQDADRDTLWNFWLNGNQINRTIDHNFSDSGSFGLIEREADCDSGFGSLEQLKNCISGGCATYRDYLDLGCRYDSISGRHFERQSATKFTSPTGDAAC